MSASTVANGYAIDNAREADLQLAWKPADSASTDEWLKVDGGSVGWMGSPAATAYFAVAYDARGSNQDFITLQTHSLDDGTFVGGSLENAFAPVALNKTGVICWYTAFAVHNPVRRYYRLIQKGTDRSGGSVTAKILSWAMFQPSDVTFMGIDFPAQSEGEYDLDPVYRTALLRGGGGMIYSNSFASPGESFRTTFKQGKDALYQKVRDQFSAIGGPARAIYVQKEGLSNPVLGSFFMCRLDAEWWKSHRRYRNQSDLSIPMVTESWQ